LVVGWVQSHIFNKYPIAKILVLNFADFKSEVKYLPKKKEESDLKRTAPRVTVPKPEMTDDKKFKCPIDQEVYDNRKDYETHCKEEHDVL
jgi:hypothetical protein